MFGGNSMRVIWFCRRHSFCGSLYQCLGASVYNCPYLNFGEPVKSESGNGGNAAVDKIDFLVVSDDRSVQIVATSVHIGIHLQIF